MARPRNKREPKAEDIRARLSAWQKARVLAAAAKANVTASEFVRDAVLVKAEAVLSDSQAAKFGDFIGILDGADVPPAREHKKSYFDLLLEENAPETRRAGRSPDTESGN